MNKKELVRRRMILKRILISLFVVFLFATLALGGSTGKITGVVKDKKSGEPLIGANIRLEGTSLGGTTDFDGKYFIINVPPNDYILNVSMVGYTSAKITEVRIRGDLTTTLDIELSETVLQIGQEVVIIAERPLVQRDLTAKTAIVSGKDIAALPVTEVGAIVSMQAGFVAGSLRGGRSGEVAYWIDGIPVTDAYDGGQIVEVNKSLVQELQVISGAFNAEYGQAMSGIVNISAKEGGAKYTGGIGVYGGDYLPADDGLFLGMKFKPNNIRNIEANLSGPLLSNDLTFFTNVRYIYFNGDLNGYRRFNPWNEPVRNIKRDIISLTSLEGKGDSNIVPMNWSERYYAQGKLTYHLTSTIKASVDYIFDDRKEKAFDRAYFYNPDGKGNNYNLSHTIIFQFNHSLSASTFYTIGGSYFKKDFRYYLYDLNYDTATTSSGELVQVEVVDPFGPHDVYSSLSNQLSPYDFLTGGTDLNKSHRTTETGLVKFDLTSQIDGMNMIKAGIEFRHHSITNESITLTDAGDQTGVQYPYMRTQIPSITQSGHDFYNHKPKEFSLYAQDKMEYKNVIINFGLRFDYFDPDGFVLNDSHPDANDPLHYMYTVDDPSIDSPIRSEHRVKGNGDAITTEERMTYWYKKAKVKYAVSPRIGVSFPITDRGIVHFSYGHFFQVPRFERLYENPRFKISKLNSSNMGIIGNADLEPEQTITAEVGVQQQLSEDVAFDVTAYMRDIRGLTGSQGDAIPVFPSGLYYKYTNSDFGIVKGIVLTLDKRFSSGITARIDYTYQDATGTASDPQQARNAKSGGALPDVQMVPLNWDQRHTLNVSLNYSAGAWGLSSIIQYGSGTPYTPSLENSGEVSTMVTNSQIKPSTFNADLRAFYEIPIKPMKLVIFTRIFNVFDTRNQTNVYPSTGRSDYSLDALQAEKTKMYVNNVEQWFKDATRYSEPRRIEFGMNLEF
jgi:outer membrane receptor for ferrienterochelin and colicin